MSTKGAVESVLVGNRQHALLAWYDRSARDLPWRRTPTLYGTWISEMMLQQTTVKAVAPRWADFVARFPDVKALAAADEADIVAAWSGLGYYRRARHLHAAARRIVADRGGPLPRTRAEWSALPGVGAYSAGAISSIGLGLAEPAVDANIRRILTRWVCATSTQARELRPKDLMDLAAVHLSEQRAGDWNQALMDLGASVCRAESAACRQCPVFTWCQAGQAGAVSSVPPPVQRRTPVKIMTGVVVLRVANDVLLLPAEDAVVTSVRGLGSPHRTGLGNLLAGTLCLPMTSWYGRSADAGPGPFTRTWRRWLSDLVGTRIPVVQAKPVTHTITHHRLLIQVHVVDLADPPACQLPTAVWRSIGGSAVPLATLTRRAISAAEDVSPG